MISSHIRDKFNTHNVTIVLGVLIFVVMHCANFPLLHNLIVTENSALNLISKQLAKCASHNVCVPVL